MNKNNAWFKLNEKKKEINYNTKLTEMILKKRNCLQN